jgi:phytoene dehydrogenase-like protein
MKPEIIVVGAGVNELVAAHYLARARREVLVLQQHATPHDAWLDSGWVPPHVGRDLALDKREAGIALTISRPDPWLVAGLPDGERLELWRDVARSADAIKRFSARDAQRWPEFCERMAALSGIMEAVYVAPPPDITTSAPSELLRLARYAFAVRHLNRVGMEDLMRILPMSIADLLDDWFESDILKGALGGAGVLHLCQGPRSGGTAFRLLHHHLGNPPGVFRPPESNLRAILEARGGVTVRRDATLRGISVRDGRVVGIQLEDGEEIAASVVACGMDPKSALLESVGTGTLDPEFTRAVRHIRSRGVTARVELELAAAAPFSMLTVAPSLNYLERAYDDVKYGAISSEPYLEARVPQSSQHRHRVEVDVQYVPHTPARWNSETHRQVVARTVSVMARAVPGFDAMVKQARVLTPPDFEARYGFPQGQPHHAELALDQALWMRPLAGWCSYRTPIKGLYLCGPGTHPGGYVAGAAGANAARVILQDARRSG